MKAKIVRKDSKSIKVEIELSITKSMLNTEEEIQKALNLAGTKITAHALSTFDSDGNPIIKNKQKYTSKGKVPKKYQTPYGEVEISRHVYQSNQGGSTFCPLDNSARIIVGSTPKFSKQVCSKYSESGSKRVQIDLESNHGRYISRSFIQNISEHTGKLLGEKQETWSYTLPEEPENVAAVGISLDGTCMLLSGDGYREAMVGTISLYDKEGERLHTQYTANAPQHGKERFFNNFEREIGHVKSLYPLATPVGIADGAKENWTFLEKHTEKQILDFYHASEYISLASESYSRFKDERVEWVGKLTHQLKHEEGGAKEILKELKKTSKKRLSDKKKEEIKRCITYFTNHLHQMKYSSYTKEKFPIGSGVVEAGCKVIIKQRLCNSGMKWKIDGANSVLSLRCLNYSDTKWEQTWSKINQYGLK